MAAQHRDWKREEHLLAFNLYCKIPFGRAFDRQLMWIEDGCAVHFSKRFHRATGTADTNFVPDTEFLKRREEKSAGRVEATK